jgi:hypothetical protein
MRDSSVAERLRLIPFNVSHKEAQEATKGGEIVLTVYTQGQDFSQANNNPCSGQDRGAILSENALVLSTFAGTCTNLAFRSI